MNARPTSPRPPRGFALLITIVLVAFLVLTFVGLASLTRVETQIVANANAMAGARQSALTALNIALGQLQSAAGPDQRVTGTADLAAADFGRRLAAGSPPSSTVGPTKYWDSTDSDNGLALVRAGTRAWTGVWGNLDSSAPVAGNGNAYERTPRPALLNWLVSGNEAVTFTASTTGADFGRITAANGAGGSTAPAFTPAAAVGGLTASTVATAALSVAGEPAILLVGSGTAGSDARPLPDGVSEPAVDRFVVAPLVAVPPPIDAPDQRLRRFAYWVGDEGVKARDNLPDPNDNLINPPSQPGALIRLATGQRVAGEFITAGDLAANRDQSAEAWETGPLSNAPAFTFDDYPRPGQTRHDDLAKILERTQAIFARPTTPPASLAKRYHAITTHSLGVLADSHQGGLRRDLSFALSSNARFNQVLGSNQNILPSAYSPTTGPRWEWVKAYHDLADRPGAAINLDAVPVGEVAPFIAGTKLMFKLYPNRATGTWQLRTGVAVWIANPYSMPLTTSGLDFAYDRGGYSPAEANYRNSRNVSGASAHWHVWALGHTGPGTRIVSFPVLYHASANTPAQTPWTLNAGGTVFQLPNTTWAPGEIKLFTLDDRTQIIASGGSVVTLTERTTSPLETHYFTYDTGVPLPPDDTPSTPYSAWLQTHPTNAGSFGRDTPAGFAFELRRRNSVAVITRAEMLSLYTAFPSTPNTTPPDLEGGILAGTLTAMANLPAQAWVTPWSNGDGTASRAPRAPRVLRPFADHNLGAAFTPFAPLTSSNLNSFQDGSKLIASFPYGGRRRQDPLDYTAGPILGSGWSWGGSFNDARTSWPRNVLYDLPARNPAIPPLLTLGQLQHARLTADDDAARTGHQPGHAVGNSWAPPLLSRNRTVETRSANNYNPARDLRFFDIAYLLNQRLFDTYFFSSFDGATPAAGRSLPNTRFQVISPDDFLAHPVGSEEPGTGPAKAALILGAFNVNSTDPEAWAAVLAASSGVPGRDNLDVGTPFPRFIHGAAGELRASQAHAGNDQDSYAGYRRLTDAHIRELARHIVQQVRQRGPFLSLGHFVNRVIEPAGAAPALAIAPLGLSGALQSAIDAAGLNHFRPLRNVGVNHWIAPNPGLDQNFYPDHGTDYPRLSSSNDPDLRPPHGSTLTGIAGFLTQADLLQSLAPVLSARSDTFVVRAYGDTLDLDGQPAARAWCEAIVQRLPDYLNPEVDPAGTPPGALNDPDNRRFGRRFILLSFRWLSANDV